MGRVVGGPQRTLEEAQRLGSDALFDEGNAVSRLIHTMGSLGSPANPIKGSAEHKAG